jgi:hypothetical protein
MADNVAVTQGSGTTIATDDISDVHFQRVKLVDGTLDSTAAIPGDASNGLDVDVTRVSGNVAVTNAGITTIAGAVAGSEMQVDVVSSALPTGASTAAKQPALGIAGTASTDVITVQGITSMTPLLTTASLAAGTNNIGDVDIASIAAGTNNIGDVDVASIAAGTNLIGKVSIDQATANANEVVTKTGSVTTATLNAETTKVIGTVNVAAAQTIAVTNAGTFATQATLQAGTAGIGKLTANSGVDIGDVDILSIAAGDNNIGNVDIVTMPVDANAAEVQGTVAHDAADAQNPVKIGTKAIAALSGATLVAAADRADAYGDLDGAVLTRNNFALGDVVSGVLANTDGASTAVIAAAGAGIKVYLTDMTFYNSSASNVYAEIKDGTTTKWYIPLPATGGATVHLSTPLAGSANTAWNLDVSAATTTVYASFSGFKSKV